MPTTKKSNSFVKNSKNKPYIVYKPLTDQAFTSALYNSLAFIIIIVGISLCGLLLVVLQAFVRSILWALLTGAFLFSFKRYLTDITCKRLENIESTSSCLSFQVVLLPIQLLDSASDYMWEFFKKKYRQLFIIICAIFIFNYINIFYDQIINNILLCVNKFTSFVTYFVNYVDNNWKISSTILIAYFLSVIFYWNNDTKFLFRNASVPIWICFLILISQILGSYRMFFLILFFILTFIGIVSYISQKVSKLLDADDISFNDICIEELGQQLEDDKSENESKSFTFSILKLSSNKRKKIPKLYERSISNNIDLQKISHSNQYFTFLFCSYVTVKVWSYPIVSIIVFIILWKLIKIITLYLTNVLFERFDFKILFLNFRQWFKEREYVFRPTPFKILLDFYFIGDRKMNKWLRDSLHSIISAFMIFALLLFVVSALVLLAMQVQDESLNLITIISDVVNENIYSHPQLKLLLPEKERVNMLLQEAINKVYVYGRDWLSNKLKSFISSVDDQKIVENQLLAQWDMLYNFLSQKASNITTNSSYETYGMNYTLMNITAVPSILSNSGKILMKQRSFQASAISGNNIDYKPILSKVLSKENYNYNHLIQIIKENIGVFMSLIDSLYRIFRSNINIIFTIVKLSISLLFQSGFVVFNFFISFIVYITALFYLLSSSTNRYKPLQWLNEITILKSNYGVLLSKAIEESISSVFVASLKMAIFYGLYTWLMHYLFGLSIAYLPSIIASVFGFLPILSTYWVSLPGVLELWFLYDQPFYALLFFVCHILPTYFVDMAIYSDIKAGHPYFTGLAIAGGVYCLGLEGALIGPIVLCLFIVIIKMNKEILSNSTNLNLKK